VVFEFSPPPLGLHCIKFGILLHPEAALLLEAVETTILFLSALFPIVNPLGGSPIFLTLTREYSPVSRRLLAQRVAINSFILLIVSGLIGTHILAFFGISLPIVQVGGGMVVVVTGWNMLQQKDDDDNPDTQVHHDVNPRDIFRSAFYPFTLPLTVGPGSISVAITLGANAARHGGPFYLEAIVLVIGSALLGVSVYICYGFSDRIATLLGPTAMSVIMRLSSFLLVCIGVQIFWNGASELLRKVIAGH
jgi:multiple antibiotic resistance protein